MFVALSNLSQGGGGEGPTFSKKSYEAESGAGIGVLEINGEIVESLEVLKIIRGFQHADSIKSLLVRVDSPGGGVAPSQEIFSELKALNDSGKKVVVSMGSMAASGGYYIAIAGERLIANPGTMTGSIGVIMQTMDASELFALAKVHDNTYKSGELKDMGSPWRAASEQDKRAFGAMIASVYDQFTRAIAEERGIDLNEVKKLADGRVYTGEQALALKLVDELGTFNRAVEVAAELGGIKGKPELVYPPSDEADAFWLRMVRGSARTFAKEVTAEVVKASSSALRSSGRARLLLRAPGLE